MGHSCITNHLQILKFEILSIRLQIQNRQIKQPWNKANCTNICYCRHRKISRHSNQMQAQPQTITWHIRSGESSQEGWDEYHFGELRQQGPWLQVGVVGPSNTAQQSWQHQGHGEDPCIHQEA